MKPEPTLEKLKEYRRKRDFKRTPEPAGPSAEDASAQASEGGRFVIHKHAARRLHYDLRLEQDGVFKSWAVPKGLGLEPGEKHLAVHVEDHPLEYGDFEGVIPEGEYGGGTVMIWDRGRWAPIKSRGRKGSDRLDFVLVGHKLRGAWTLTRMTGRAAEEGDNWLLIKRHDNADGTSEPTDLSVATGRSMEKIAADRNRTWTRAGEQDVRAESLPDPARLPGARKASLPRTAAPQMASGADKAPAGNNWLHEIKFDGYRILARCARDGVRLISRNGKDWTARFPETATLLAGLASDQVLLDGEVVAFQPDGTTSFSALQEALSSKNTQGLVYQVFDILHLNGVDLTAVPLKQRKDLLAALVEASGFTASAGVRYATHIQGQGPAFAEQACRLGLEGIVCKRADSRYKSGRGGDWLKVKCADHEEFVVGGFSEPGGSRSGFGALLLGAWRGERLVYTGKVGAGFSEFDLARLAPRLRELEVRSNPFAGAPRERGQHWVQPQLVARVEFTEWTRDGLLRHPVFQGLREDREADEVQMPQNAPKAGPPDAAAGEGTAVAGIDLSHPGRILYPEQGITKLALAQYYEEIAPWILPHLAFRPLSLVRCPEGYEQECFFQKHPRATMAKSIPRVRIEESEGPAPYLYVSSLSDIVALVQSGALELHVWGSRVDRVEQPDILVFDLDPAPDVPFAELIRVARELRDYLDSLGLASFPRTTGGKGLHLVIPIQPERDWEQVKAFCQAAARGYARENRTRVTTNMAKSKRRGRIFIDYLRNGRGATAIASYSTRARPGAPVAVPIAWDELNEALRPDRYTVQNLRRRLAVLRSDPWEGFAAARRSLTAPILHRVGMNVD